MVSPRIRTLILGAAGRDFHDFNTVFRSDPQAEVVAFTAAQIPGISGRIYPPSLAGPLYPAGVPILPESGLEEICREQRIDRAVFAYSDVPHEHVMHLASRALALGANFELLGPRATMLASRKPVIAVSAVRTGCGKSAVARWLSRYLRQGGERVAVLRHPMPYGDLERARVQRFASSADLDAAQCTAEEREEYEPHLRLGNVVFAGVDYEAVLRAAEPESDIIVWDGGNNDFPFIAPDLHLVVVDALRPRQIATHHPGEAVLRMADVVIVNKVDSASPAAVREASQQVGVLNPRASIVKAASPVRLADPGAVRGKRVLIVEDGPTITHGGMPYGAGYVAALAAGAQDIVDPRSFAPPELTPLFEAYPHIGKVLPAVGYSPQQIEALAVTIERSDAELVIAGTPIDLASLVRVNKPVIRATYEFAEAGKPTLRSLVDAFLLRRLGRPETRKPHQSSSWSD
jgi:predicted GTPase